MKLLRLFVFAFLIGWLMAACTPMQAGVSTRNYMLTTGFKDGNLVFLGVGGDINGMVNPTLYANPGEIITVTLINGGEGIHDIYFPKLKVRSKRVSERGESVSITFRVPDQEGVLEYHDSVANHSEIGMVGSLQIFGSAVRQAVNPNGTTDTPGQTSGQPDTQGQIASEGKTIFDTKCAACHTIGGGKLVGPDLKGVTVSRDITWLTNWLKAPDKVLASGDPIATELLKEFNNIPMPNLGLSDAEVSSLVGYFQSVDGTSVAAPAPAQETSGSASATETTTQPLTGDPAYGKKLFTGEVALVNGGTHCMACHSVEGVGVLDGGALGPNLTHVYSRYGQSGLAASLESLPFPTMQGVFAGMPLTSSEQVDLLAYFASVDLETETPNQQNFWLVLGSGSALASVWFIGMLFFWPRQRLSLSQRLRKYGKL